MVIIDQLRISDDGRQMYINAHVNTADAFKYVGISSIVIATADKVSETAVDPPSTGYIYKQDFENTDAQHLTKEIALVLPSASDPNPWLYSKSSLSGDLFFVYIVCTKVQDDPCLECLPCIMTRPTTVAVTFDENLLYQKVMGYTKELADDCTIPRDFTDFILQWNAFKSSVETEHWESAKKFYELLFGNSYGSSKSGTYGTPKPCGCHG